MSRALTLIGAIGPVAHVVLVLTLSAIVDGYDPLRDSISELGARDAPSRWLMNLAGFTGLGVALLAFAAGYHLLLRRSRLAPLATGLLVVAGGFMVAVGFFPCDPGCVDVTLTGRLHSLTSTPQAIALPLAGVVSVAVFRTDGRLGTGWQAFSFWTGLAALATGPLVGADLAGDATGLVQRAGMWLSLFWVATVSLKLHRLAAETRRRNSAGLRPRPRPVGEATGHKSRR